MEIPLADGRLPALLTHPVGAAAGAVLILHDVYGRTPFYEHLAARLATAGYRALLPDFFFREGTLPVQSPEAASARRARADSRRLLRDALGAADWLAEGAGRLGVVGFCMGGNYALALAAERTDLATICYYGFPGRAIHFTEDPAGPTPIDLAPRIAGPVIGFWGDQDHGAGMDNVAAFAVALKENGGHFEHHVYAGLGHGFMAASRLDADHSAYADSCDSWTRSIQFLRRHVT